MTKANECTCPSGDGSLRHPCPAHPASVELAGVGAKLTFINGRPAMCGCQVEYSSGGGEYSDVIYVTLCAKHSGSAILDLVATNRIALTPEYEGQWHADLYLDREIPLAKADGATPAEAVLALMSAERIDPEQESVEQAGGDERAAFRPAQVISYRPGMGEVTIYVAGRVPGYMNIGDTVYVSDRAPVEQPSAALAQPSPAQAEQAEAERPEAVAWQYRVTAGPQTGWSLWHPGKGEEFERSYTVERRPLMTVAQYDRIVGELRAVITQLRQHKNDYMDSGQETYRALQNEIREREAEIARLDGLVSGRTAERDAALARVASLESKLAELEKQDLVDVPGPDEIHQMAFEEGQPADDGDGYLFSAEEFDLFVQRLLDSCAAPVAQAQHSVPAYVSYTTRPAESLAGIALRQLKDESRWVEIRDINAHAFPDMQSHSYYPAGTVIKLPAAAPGKEVGHE
ncbi:hypothetical protein LZL27_12330 [Pseudomonas aeruginosa]|nr:hypothetical protein [Pseudomonas aeruginosa]